MKQALVVEPAAEEDILLFWQRDSTDDKASQYVRRAQRIGIRSAA